MFKRRLSALAILTVLTCVTAGPVRTSPVQGATLVKHKRQWAEGILSGIASLLNIEWLQLHPSPLCGVFMGTTEFWVLQNQDPNGLYWQACWKEDADLITFGQPEVDVTNCLVDLHFQQDDNCISVAGSYCQDTYSGNVQNLRYIGSLTTNGYSSIAQLTGDQSDAIQGAVSAINGVQVNGGDTVGPTFWLTDSTGTKTDGSYQGWQVNWQGEQTC